MEDVRQDLANTVAGLEELWAKAHKLTNQNLADVVKSAIGKLQQLSNHPDLEQVEDKPAEVQPPAAQPVEAQPFPGTNPGSGVDTQKAADPNAGTAAA